MKNFRSFLFSLFAFCLAAQPASAKLFDGGVDSANLGKGEWVYILSSYFGSYVPSVNSPDTLMAYCKTNLSCQYIVVKAAEGGSLFNGPQFTASLVNSAHAHGLKIFGYTRSYGTDPVGESAMADYVNGTCGADGFIFDAEQEWESLANNQTVAYNLCGMVKTNWPTRFLAHSPQAIISVHNSFPYKEFGYWCDAAMPQDYWVDFGKTPTATIQWMDQNWGNWQNGLSGKWTNAIKPIAPVGQADSTSQPGTDITEFVNYLKTDPGCVTKGGYKGCVFFRPGLQTQVMLDAIAAAQIGNLPPTISTQPQSQTVVVGQVATFNVVATGPPAPTYQWKRNGTNIAGATLSSYARANIQMSDAGTYSVLATNVAGSILSSNAVLTVVASVMPPSIATPPQSQTIGAGQTATFTVVANGTATLAYQWFLNGSTIGGATTTSYSIGNTGNYSVRVTNSVGSVTSQVAVLSTVSDIIIDNSDAACVLVGSWITQTTSTDKYGANYNYTSGLTAGKTATYTPNISATGSYDVYIWYPQGGNRSTAAPWSVFYNGGSITTPVNQQTGGGGWRIIASSKNFISGTAGYVQLANNHPDSGQNVMADGVKFTLSAVQPPSITTSPQTQTAKVGTNLTFTVAVNGTGPLTYQWQWNNANISGATQGTYTIHNLQFTNAGTYAVIVGNTAGTVTSASAQLTVTAPTFQFNSITIAANRKIHLLLGGDADSYVIEASADFTTWQPLTNAVISSGPVDCIDPATNGLMRFYRARVGP